MLRKLIAFGCLVTCNVFAASYPLPPEGSNIVGRIQYHKVIQGETIAEIAKQYDVGFLALMAANKGIDPFLPEADYMLTIPSKIILPNMEREGVVINLADRGFHCRGITADATNPYRENMHHV